MVAVVLVGPKTAGNVGAVARVMKNFGMGELWLVHPQCDHLSMEAMGRAKHARDVLKKARTVNSFAALRKKFSCVMGTTSKVGSDYNIVRSPLSPEQAAALVQKRKSVALVFGREDSGLLNAELLQCDCVVSIPASRDYPALNVSHAVAVMLYVVFAASQADHTTKHIAFASQQEKDLLLQLINQKILLLPFSTASKRKTQRIVWQRLIGKSFLTRREIFALFGLFKKIKK